MKFSYLTWSDIILQWDHYNILKTFMKIKQIIIEVIDERAIDINNTQELFWDVNDLNPGWQEQQGHHPGRRRKET